MRLIKKEVSTKNLKGAKIAGAPPISKFCDADDVLLCCNAKMDELSSLKKCLERYRKWSSSKINMVSSGMFPSKSVCQQFLNQVKCVAISKTKYVGVCYF